MVLSTPPPPPDPPSTTNTSAITAAAITIATTTTTTTNSTSTANPPRPIFPPNPRPPPPPPPPPHPNSTSHPFQAPFFSPPHHPHPPNPRLPSNPNPNYPHLLSPSSNPHEVATTPSAILYPVASSGRGFLSKQTPPPVTLTLPNPTSPLYHSRPGLSQSFPRPPFAYSHPDPSLAQGMGYVTGRPAHMQHPSLVGNAAGVMPGVIKGVPVSSASSQSQHKITISPNPSSDCNGHKDLRERSKDESALATIRDRKVKISDNASIYSLCRSWLRNGFPEDNQVQYIDSARSLPRPLPLSAQEVTSPVKRGGDKEKEEDEGSVEHLTPQELLRRHVKHAKRVRTRLREERLRRIARYKTRLALLLPPMVDPQLRNDLAPGS